MSGKKSILFIDQHSLLGGGQRVLLDMVKFFKREGHSPFVMVPTEGFVTHNLQIEDIPFATFTFKEFSAGRKNFYDLITYPYFSFKASSDFEEILSLKDFNLIFANGPRVFFPSVLAGKKTGIKVHLQLHLTIEGRLEQELIKWLIKEQIVKSIIFCSQTVAKPFNDVKNEKSFVVPYWVSPTFLNLPKRRKELREKFGFNGEMVVGVVGRISKTKGQYFFLNSIMDLFSKYEKLIVMFCGTSDFESLEEEKKLKNLANNSAFKERIIFSKACDSIDVMDCFDILVVPSLWEEAFGLVAVEGMARELPLLVTKSGALKEIVLDKETGLVAEKDEEDIRKKLELLLENEKMREEMGRKGRERVLEFFNPEIQMKKIMEIALNGI